MQNPPVEWIAAGSAYVDTFTAEPGTVRDAAAAILLHDGWRFAATNDSPDTLTSAWKPLDKLFVRLLFGNVQARCRVTFRGVAPGRTQITFRADAATPRTAALSALRANADRAYAKAARDWAAHMRRVLAGTDMPPAEAWAAAREIGKAPPHATTPP